MEIVGKANLKKIKNKIGKKRKYNNLFFRYILLKIIIGINSNRIQNLYGVFIGSPIINNSIKKTSNLIKTFL